MLLKKPSFYLALIGVAATFAIVNKSRQRPPAPPPLVEPARSPFARAVAATGIIEAANENVRIAATHPGLIEKLFVKVGTKVKKGDPLFQIDSREAAARLESMKAQLDSMKAAIATEEVSLADMQDQFKRVRQLEKDKVASDDEVKRKQFALEGSQARLNRMKADIQSATRQVEHAAVELNVLKVTAPRDGTILQVNVREGEYAATQTAEPLLILGDTETLDVRCDVDEQDAHMVVPNTAAVAFLKGSTQNKISLRFERIEPFVVPKKSLTGDSTERVDTRVLQIIYRFDRPAFPVYVGQQVDVFIDRPAASAAVGAR